MIGSSVLSIQQLQYLCNLQLTFYLTCFSQFLFSFLLHVAASLFDPLPSTSNGLFSRGNLKNACLLAEPNPWLQLGQGQPLAVIQCSANELSANKWSIYWLYCFYIQGSQVPYAMQWQKLSFKLISKLNQIHQKN